MKKIILSLLVLAGIVVKGYSQAKDSLYIVTYTTGPLWTMEKQPYEQPYFKEHGARLGQLRKDGSSGSARGPAKKELSLLRHHHLRRPGTS